MTTLLLIVIAYHLFLVTGVLLTLRWLHRGLAADLQRNLQAILALRS